MYKLNARKKARYDVTHAGSSLLRKRLTANEFILSIGAFRIFKHLFVHEPNADRTAALAEMAAVGKVIQDGETRTPTRGEDKSSYEEERAKRATLRRERTAFDLPCKNCISMPREIVLTAAVCVSNSKDSADRPVFTRKPPKVKTSRTTGTFSEVPAITPDPHVTNRFAGTKGMNRVPMPNMIVAPANRPALFQCSTFSTSVNALVSQR